MARQPEPESEQTPLDFDDEAAFEKAVVRLAHASRPVAESFLALRVAAVLFQVAGVATLVAGVLGAVVLGRSHLDDTLGFAPEYLSVVLAVICAGAALRLFVLRDQLNLQLSVARNTHLMAVLLAEMNFADRAHALHPDDQGDTHLQDGGRPDDPKLSVVADLRGQSADDAAKAPTRPRQVAASR